MIFLLCSERIEEFIDENKALMRRMYGDFTAREPDQSTKRKRSAKFKDHIPGVPDVTAPFGQKLEFFSTENGNAGGDSYFGQLRNKRQSNTKTNKPGNQRDTSPPKGPGAPTPSNEPSSGRFVFYYNFSKFKRRFHHLFILTQNRLDACESKIEIVTPYWASNSAGKIRAIVNTQHFEQAIHQEVCT